MQHNTNPPHCGRVNEGEAIQFTRTKHMQAGPQIHLSEGGEIRQFHLFIVLL